MKQIFLTLALFLFAATAFTQNTVSQKASTQNLASIAAPDLADVQMKQYFGDFTAFLKKVIPAIRNKDEAATMKMLTAIGNKFDNLNEIEKKAQSRGEQTYNNWFMKIVPYQKELILSDYFSKFYK
jgi:hypothetical protein